jgi:uncharacterized protein (DUF305 family)
MIAVGALLTACSTAPSQAQAVAPASGMGEAAAIARAREDSIRRPYTQADIDFMNGMIAHHSQAIVMAKWAPSHGASAALQTMCARIINAQRDEILIMQSWLRDRNQPVPAPDTLMGMGMSMHGDHQMLMPGMLSAEQLHQLDQARGQEFDKLFLQFMIQHHQGAVSMVDDLFGTYGAAQDQLTFKLANDISADQTSEITRMQKMLVALAFGPLPAGTNP